MVEHKIICPKCGKAHMYTSNITKPNRFQSSMSGYTTETPTLNCECGYEISVHIKVKITVY